MRTKRRLLIAVILVLAVIGAGVAVVPRITSGSAEPANDLSSQRLYARAFQRAIAQPNIAIHIVRSSLIEEDLGGTGRSTVTDSIRYARPARFSAEETRVGGLAGSALGIVLADRRFCISVNPGDWACSPAHQVSSSWYLQQYFLGGLVRDIRFEASQRAHAGSATVVKLTAQGMLGCTPTGAGAGTRKGYSWCRFELLSGEEQQRLVTGEMTIDQRTGLPIRFTARGAGSLSPVIETATFSYGGRFSVTLPSSASHVPCLSWIPAIHCVELGKGRY